MVSPAVLTDKHRRDQVRLAITADSQARRAWDATLKLDDLKGSQPIWKRTMVDLLSRWYHLSARMAARYLPEYRKASIGEPDDGVTIAMPRFDRAQASERFDWMGATNVLWHLAKGETEQAAWEAARSLFLGMFHEAVLTGGRRTIQEWAAKDTRATGWRRVSDGDPCAFCAMLVTRGPVYTSEETALHADTVSGKYHAHCGCTVEVVYGDWQPTEREQQWIDDYYRAAEQVPKGQRTWDKVLPLMRKEGAFRDSPIIRTPKTSDNGRVSLARVVGSSHRAASSGDQKVQRVIARFPPHEENGANVPVIISDEVREHILHGDGKKLGGHLHGTGTLGKTEFPEEWDSEAILSHVEETIVSPDWFVPAPNERALTTFGKEVDGVQIEVRAYFRNDRFEIDRAYPVGGENVFRNTKDGKIAVKRSTSRKWRDTP